MTHCNTILPVKCHSSYGFDAIDHLVADGTGFTGGQVTIVAAGQIGAIFGDRLRLEIVYCLQFPEDIQLVVIVACNSSLFLIFSSEILVISGENVILFVTIV